MTLSDITNMITFYTGVGTTEYSNANRVININRWIQKITTMILSSQDGWDYDDINIGDYPILTSSLVANQQDYTLPASEKILQIKRVEISYDGTNWRRAFPMDINERQKQTDTTSISNDFSTSEPYYDIQYNAIFLYPIPTSAVSGGLKLWVSREHTTFTASDLTTGTAEPGFDEPFHEMVAIGASFEYAVAKNQANSNNLKALLTESEIRLKQYYGKKEKERHPIMKGSPVNYK